MMVFVKPADRTMMIRIPGNKQILPNEGTLVELNSFWRRRISDGSVIVVDQKAKKQEYTEPKKSLKEDKT